MRNNLRVAAAALLAIVAAVLVSNRPRPKIVEFEGHVYQGCDNAHLLTGPIDAAVVSTSLDSTTAVTDENGHFHLITRTRAPLDQIYTLTVQAGTTVVNATMVGPGTRDYNFTFSSGLWGWPQGHCR